jgi:small subunit ribosomal protein S4
MRLDNVIYRLGFADSRRQARELVSHGHFTLNGRKTNIPSCLVKLGDTIAWAEGNTKLEYYKTMARSIQSKTIPSWLSLDMQTLTGRVLAAPGPGDSESIFDVNVVVGYYSR